MKFDWPDIAWHTVPTVSVGTGMGFMAATGFHVYTPAFAILNLAVTIAAIAGFSYIWSPREKLQHGGELGGWQSKLEAYVPLLAGPFAFVASTAAFWIWPI